MKDWTDREIVDELCSVEDGLSEWEVNFVDSLAKWLKDRPLTAPQRRKAEELLKKLEGR